MMMSTYEGKIEEFEDALNIALEKAFDAFRKSFEASVKTEAFEWEDAYACFTVKGGKPTLYITTTNHENPPYKAYLPWKQFELNCLDVDEHEDLDAMIKCLEDLLRKAKRRRQDL